MPNNPEAKRHGKMEITSARIAFLSRELMNGGRALTFEELRDAAHAAHPGGFDMSPKLVQRVAFGVENGITPQNRSEASEVTLPNGREMTRWLEEREEKRVKILKKREANARWREKTAAPKKPRKHAKHKNQTEKDLEAVETTPENIRTVLSELPTMVSRCLDTLKGLMQDHQYSEVQATMLDGELHITVKAAPPVIYAKR